MTINITDPADAQEDGAVVPGTFKLDTWRPRRGRHLPPGPPPEARP